MRIDKENDDGVMVLTLNGRLDTQYADSFQEELMAEISAGQKNFVIDCSGVDYMNSAGLKVFLLGAKKLEPTGGRIVICGLAANVLMIFELTGFHVLFAVRPTRSEARAEFP